MVWSPALKGIVGRIYVLRSKRGVLVSGSGYGIEILHCIQEYFFHVKQKIFLFYSRQCACDSASALLKRGLWRHRHLPWRRTDVIVTVGLHGSLPMQKSILSRSFTRLRHIQRPVMGNYSANTAVKPRCQYSCSRNPSTTTAVLRTGLRSLPPTRRPGALGVLSFCRTIFIQTENTPNADVSGL